MRVERDTGAFAEIRVFRQMNGIGNGVVRNRWHRLCVRESRRHHEPGGGAGDKAHESAATHCAMLGIAAARAKRLILLDHGGVLLSTGVGASALTWPIALTPVPCKAVPCKAVACPLLSGTTAQNIPNMQGQS